MQKSGGFPKGSVKGKIAGQKALVTRQYNARIQKAQALGNTGSANALKAVKSRKHREIEELYA